MKVVISGYYGSKNGGDEAMLSAILEGLKAYGVDATVISLNPPYTKKRHHVHSVGLLDIVAIIRELRAADLLISGGGSLLQNVTSRRSLYYYLGIIFLAKLLGRKVMLYAQGIGPIEGVLAKWLTKHVVNRADLITVRDAGSLEELRRLSITKPPIYCTADAALALKPTPLSIGKKILEANGARGRLIGVAVRRWKSWQPKELAAALERLSKSATIVFLPMQYPDDVQAARETAALMSQSVVLEGEYSTAELMSLVGNMNLLISIRLHALIFAGVMSVPMLGLSYDPKIERFLWSIGEVPLGKLSEVTAEQIYEAAVQKMNDKKMCDETLLKKLRRQALENARLAVEVMKWKQ